MKPSLEQSAGHYYALAAEALDTALDDELSPIIRDRAERRVRLYSDMALCAWQRAHQRKIEQLIAALTALIPTDEVDDEPQDEVEDD